MFELFAAFSVFSFLVFSFAITVTIHILWKIWTVTPEAKEKYRLLQDLTRRANDGQADAEHECENNLDIKTTLYWDKRWGTRKRYSIRLAALYACFGFF